MKEPTSAYIVSHNDVTNNNFKSYFPEIIKKLNNASHIAVDLEFTALGGKLSEDMRHRYAAMKKVVEAASIASLGLSVFRQIDSIKPPPLKTAHSESSISSQPVMGKSVPVEDIEFSITYSQPILPKSKSVLSKEEEEGLILSFLENDDDEFSLPVCSSTKNDQTTTLLNDGEFSVAASETATTKMTTDQNVLPTPIVGAPLLKQYECDNFNFMTLKQGTIHLETAAGQFLVNHGYSFDKLFLEGIPFTPSSTATGEEFNSNHGAKPANSLRNLWKHLICVLRFHKIPFIVHNGYYDLMYIYHSFIGVLPETFQEFNQRLANSFPCGIYDTRYLASQDSKMNATFLSYVFNASDRLRQDRFGKNDTTKPYFEVIVKAPILSQGNSLQLVGQKRRRGSVEVERGSKKGLPYCKLFSERGYCSFGHDHNSPMHDVQIILDHQFGPSAYPQVYTSQIDDIEGAHAAHFDAYMTGFSYCYFQHTFSTDMLKSYVNKMIPNGITILTLPTSKTVA